MRRYMFVIVLASFFTNAISPEAHGQFCGVYLRPQSVLDRIADFDIVLVGQFQNVVKPNNALPNGQSEFRIESVLKNHKLIGERKVIILDQVVDRPQKFILAAEMFQGKVGSVFGLELNGDGAELVRFVRGAMQLKDRSLAGRLPYVAPFLHSANKEVAESAHIDFENAKYSDVRKVAEKMDPVRLIKAIQDPKTPPDFRGNFVVLLGHCGKKEHVVVVRKLLDAVDSDYVLYANKLFATYIMLDPDAGRKRLIQILGKAEAPFLNRFWAFDAVKKLRANRPDLLSQKQANDAACCLLADPMIADFAIEELRRWETWGACDDILALVHLKKHQAPIVKKAILHYSLQCPLPQAKAHVIQMQALDAEWVQDTRELLALEDEVPQPKQK